MARTNAPIIVYHGTIVYSANDIAKGIDLSKCKPINDVSLGFYVTTHRQQAIQLANMNHHYGPVHGD
jgi:hypothetical protein